MDSPISVPLAISAQLVKDGNTVLNALLSPEDFVKRFISLHDLLRLGVPKSLTEHIKETMRNVVT